MTGSTLLGIVSLVALLAFVLFAFRQGIKVTKGPEGTPPEYSGGLDGGDSSVGHP